jgi:hypothetical protein
MAGVMPCDITAAMLFKFNEQLSGTARENATSVGNMEWSGAQHAFIVDRFLKNRESVIATQ